MSRSLSRLLLLAALASGAGSMKVVVTGAGGRTGSLCFKKLRERAGVEAVGCVRSLPPAKLYKRLGASRDELDGALAEVDVTNGPEELTSLLQREKAEALMIATSAVPKIKPLSILKALALKPFGKSARPSFRFPPGGTPEEVDWLGQKSQIDAAVASGCVKHVVLCSSMGGTDAGNFLNTIGLKPDGSGGSILLWKRKAEKYLVASGIDYTILHPGGLLDQPGGRRIVLGVDDELLKRKVRSIPRDDVAEVMVLSLFVPKMRKRSVDLISEDAPRDAGALLSTLETSGLLGNCDYNDKSLPEPKSQF